MDMKTIAVYCEPCSELSLALNEIEERVPCFVNWFFTDDSDSIYAEIECRQEDAVYVEKMLAPFV